MDINQPLRGRQSFVQFEAHSAGLEPKDVNPFTVRVMQEKGIDISQMKSKGIHTYLGKVLFQTLITVCVDAERNCPTVWPGVKTRLHWSFEDPAAFEGTHHEKLAKFRQIRDQIEQRIQAWLDGQGVS
jgi:arsenate reductase